MSLTKEQAEKLRKLHVKHVQTANALAVYEDRDLDAKVPGRGSEEWVRMQKAWRAAHKSFYAFVDELEDA